MPRIAIELDMPASFAEAAKRQGLLSSPALFELIRRELEKMPPSEAAEFNPADYPPGYQPWMLGVVSPDLFGSVTQNCTDEELMEPLDVDWEATHESLALGMDAD